MDYPFPQVATCTGDKCFDLYLINKTLNKNYKETCRNVQVGCSLNTQSICRHLRKITPPLINLYTREIHFSCNGILSFLSLFFGRNSSSILSSTFTIMYILSLLYYLFVLSIITQLRA